MTKSPISLMTESPKIHPSDHCIKKRMMLKRGYPCRHWHYRTMRAQKRMSSLKKVINLLSILALYFA